LYKSFIDHETLHQTLYVVGRMGYLAPEYVYSAIPKEKTYVYSFGVVVLKVAMRRRPVDDDGTVIVDWVWDLQGKGKKRSQILNDHYTWIMSPAEPNSFGSGRSRTHQHWVLLPAESISVGSNRTQQFVSDYRTQSLLDLAWPLNPMYLKDSLFFLYIKKSYYLITTKHISIC